ncbi:MAG: hypothetical protein ACP5GX_06570 [Anaerolineae bacterium]
MMVHEESVMDWLLESDPAIRWQVLQDLVGADEKTVTAERAKVATEGWGPRLLVEQEPHGQFGGGLYSPKWISTTYTMALLRRMGLPPSHPQARKSCRLLLDEGFYKDGGINFSVSYNHSETCITGIILAILAYFRYDDDRVDALVEHLLDQQLGDGGWNCRSYRGDTHSSFHTTINVLEGLREYEKAHADSDSTVGEAQTQGREFLLVHRLFRSHRTGEVVDARMTRFSFPPRWYYDILRALDYFQDVNAPFDERLDDALAILEKKRRKDGRWPLQNRHPGEVYFRMEEGRSPPSRWNTLRALRVLNWVGRTCQE